jgi:hypothetical protein
VEGEELLSWLFERDALVKSAREISHGALAVEDDSSGQKIGEASRGGEPVAAQCDCNFEAGSRSGMWDTLG